MCGHLTTIAKRRNTRVLVAITGGIAAYKSPDLVRRLMQQGADVRVMMSQSALEFITPLTLHAVSGHAVYQHLFTPHSLTPQQPSTPQQQNHAPAHADDYADDGDDDYDAESAMAHIEIARWAEVIVVAPASANFIAKMVHGLADDLLTTTLLATMAEVIIVPAMNQQMWQSPANQANMQTLKERKIRMIGPAAGDQACGETGLGRMVDPAQIASEIMGEALPKLLHRKNILITAGPTWEAIDPVRGITNHSSGKMGFALAEAARDLGANVDLVAGPVQLETPRGFCDARSISANRRDIASGCRRYDVISAMDMRNQVLELVAAASLFIGVAAVADYRPAHPCEHKIKKTPDNLNLPMLKNPDILREVAHHNPRPFTVGFALESQDLLKNAQKKRLEKNADIIIANNLLGEFAAPRSDQNAVTLLHRGGNIEIQRMEKYALAAKLLEHIHQLMSLRQ